MLRVGDGGGGSAFISSGCGGEKGFGNGPIYITSKLGTMKVGFDLTEPDQVVCLGEFGKLGSVLGGRGKRGSHETRGLEEGNQEEETRQEELKGAMVKMKARYSHENREEELLHL